MPYRFFDPISRIKILLPGLCSTTVLAIAAHNISGSIPIPASFLALVFGILFCAMRVINAHDQGVEFASRHLLQLAICLLGLRLGSATVSSIEIGTTVIVIFCALATIAVTVAIASILRLDYRFGLLAGAAVGLCGTTAAFAVSGALASDDRYRPAAAFVSTNTTLLSTLAMALYPPIFKALGFDDTNVGVLVGATIHDIAQVVAAGYGVSNEAGDAAVLTKLTRVILLPVLILLIPWLVPGAGTAGRSPRVPAFAVIVLLSLGIGSLDLLPPAAVADSEAIAQWSLLIALAAIGLKMPLRALSTFGFRHLMLIVVSTASLLAGAVILTYLSPYFFA